ncbi:hypothetical protein PtA15_10A581 [Puccinia triticina]|uniref:Uncharacterized protein n=2 Tax=Puccinia triticina TaxID=208348 RepID=A0ABY7D2H4_9BASI|nr:uncharacterized protein PtA15_10A581 [Puccinia triticina]WAQ89157.1 hypothetical protein PtA15_10A581 [Puccinia triticina]
MDVSQPIRSPSADERAEEEKNQQGENAPHQEKGHQREANKSLTQLGIIMLLSLLIYQMISSLGSHFFSSANLPNPICLLAGSLTSFSTAVVYFYCATLHGPFCTPKYARMDPDQISQIAPTISGTAQKASDIFDSVIQLTDRRNLGINQSEILHYASKFRWSSELTNKDILKDELVELVGMTDEVNHKLVDLNRHGWDAFSFISYGFSRLGDLIHSWVQTANTKHTSQTIANNLKIWYGDLSTKLNRLLVVMESLIPLASRVSNLGIRVSERLQQERFQLINKISRQGLWKKLADLTTSSGKQLHNDLALISESIKSVKFTWIKLQAMYTDLLAYQNHVAHLKASLIGWHLVDHQLAPEDKLLSMREAIQYFETKIKVVKSNSKSPYFFSYSTDTKLNSDA